MIPRPAYLILCFLSFFPLISTESAYGQKISDMGRAMEYCRENPIDRIEGIYEFPEDNTSVLIRLSDQRKRRYELVVISSPDCRLSPGDILGEMTGSVDPDKFHLSLFTSRKGDFLTDSSNCLAQFDETDAAIRVKPRKLKISLRLSRILPKFWRLLSMFRFSIDDPTDDLPKGLIRIFPNRYGDRIERTSPIYL